MFHVMLMSLFLSLNSFAFGLLHDCSVASDQPKEEQFQSYQEIVAHFDRVELIRRVDTKRVVNFYLGGHRVGEVPPLTWSPSRESTYYRYSPSGYDLFSFWSIEQGGVKRFRMRLYNSSDYPGYIQRTREDIGMPKLQGVSVALECR
jgi:hypothetical protein